jgi:hypothetical protein
MVACKQNAKYVRYIKLIYNSFRSRADFKHLEAILTNQNSIDEESSVNKVCRMLAAAIRSSIFSSLLLCGKKITLTH